VHCRADPHRFRDYGNAAAPTIHCLRYARRDMEKSVPTGLPAAV
jgi:hypothetical protein